MKRYTRKTKQAIASSLRIVAETLLASTVYAAGFDAPLSALVLASSLPPSDEDFAGLDHLTKVREKLYAERPFFGTKRGVRLDIPSVQRGIPVVSFHERPSGGEVIGYDHSAVIDDAKFIVQTAGARDIGALGANKRPMSYIGGTIVAGPAKPEGTPIYYDPRKVHLYVDAHTMEPVKGAARVNMIGKHVYAQGIQYFAPGEAPEPPEGMESLVKMPTYKERVVAASSGKYHFVGSCVDLDGRLIDWIRGNSTDIGGPKPQSLDFEDFAALVPSSEFQHGPDAQDDPDAPGLDTDWHVGFYTSKLPSGGPVAYYTHSGIEWVYVPKGHYLNQEAELTIIKKADDAVYGPDVKASLAGHLIKSFCLKAASFTDESGKFWGNQGAGAIFLAEDTGRILLQHRSPYVNEPGTYGVLGGAIEADEDPMAGMKREVDEEADYHGPMRARLIYLFKSGKFRFFNYLVVVPHEFEPKHSWESDGHVWTTLDNLPSPLHFGVEALLPRLKQAVADELDSTALKAAL